MTEGYMRAHDQRSGRTDERPGNPGPSPVLPSRPDRQVVNPVRPVRPELSRCYRSVSAVPQEMQGCKAEQAGEGKMRPAGFEPATPSLAPTCSIQTELRAHGP